MGAMGVPRNELPDWNDIQIMVAQLHRKPLMEDILVGTNLVIGPNVRKPLELKIPLFVSDMSFGALSEEAKTAMALGADGVALANSAMQAIGLRRCPYLQYQQLPRRNSHSKT